jgi:pyrimidine-specific ribonucleoside hydrolase
MIDLHLDMETSDPDDVLALCLLATHPQVNLRLVTLHPGGWDQVAVVRTILRRLKVGDIPVGGRDYPSPKRHVSQFHYDWLGPMPDEEPSGAAFELIARHCPGRAMHLVTGAALTNVHRGLLKHADQNCLYKEWTCQGGFAGDNVVPEQHRLEKFRGKTTCPTFNLNGDVDAARELLGHPRMGKIRMVSKNVCHGFRYDKDFHLQVPAGAHHGLDLLREGMEFYFEKHPDGKALHDVLAAVLAVEPRIGTWATVVPVRERGEWGSLPVPDSVIGSVRILVAVDRAKVVETMAS